MIRGLTAQLLRGPSSLAVAGMVVNLANLMANLALARLLDSRGYGAVIELTNIFLILSMVGSALQVAVVQRDTAIEDPRRLSTRAWVRRLRGVLFVATLAASLLGLLLASPITDLLSFPHPFAFAEVVCAAALWAAISVERALLQARGSYQALAGNLLLEGSVRVSVTVVLVAAGWGTNGAGAGLIVGMLAGVEHARRASARTVRPARPVRPRPSGIPRLPGGDPLVDTGPLRIPARPTSTLRTVVTDTLVAAGALIPLSALQNLDVVIVGRINPREVGAYAAIATACKVPVFVGLAVAYFLLPEAARRHQEGRPATKALMLALAWVALPGLGLTAFSLVEARWLLETVFGPHLAAGAPALWVLSLAMTLLAATLLFTNYLLGVGQRRVVAVVTVGVVVTAGGLVAAGGGLVATAAASLACEAVLAVAAGWYVVRSHPSSRARPGPRVAPGRRRPADDVYGPPRRGRDQPREPAPAWTR